MIRLLTRLIFVWFIKEKGLIPPDLFDRARLRELLKTDPAANPEVGNYYLAILQNLFFATLNVETGTDEQGNRRRRWASENKSGGPSGHYLIPSVYRHKELFKDPDAALALFATIPFLNGGLFECLDRELTEPDFQRNPELKPLAVKEGSGWVLRVDGFSRRKEAQAVVPNKLFFGSANADLNTDLGTKGKRYEVRGLIDLFDRYKFTVDENTPVEEEVALDPELLGKVFENLLASYNEDTQTTARKQSGSFYTPREVVDYMVDEALIAYLENCLNADWVASVLRSAPLFKGARSGINAHLRHLLAYHHEPHQFNEAEVKALVQAIDDLRILDPACGSGAFPTGILHKLVFVLGKLDPDNRHWRDIQRQRAVRETEEAYQIGNRDERRVRLEEIDDSFERNTSDYGRKLYLIEDCIYGVDIQPIAVQIAKLRFFISLVVEQRKNPALENLGIRPLPNLETKFVAANTLLGLGGQILMRSPEVIAKEKELKQVRERYFNVRKLANKVKYREQDARLRDEIIMILKRDGYETDVADRLANWNPYDQNKAADFFDPEWMLGLQKGFDIVIGNPPYVRQEKIKDLKPLFKKNYQCFTGVADLYVYFSPFKVLQHIVK
ncbi:MAG: Eco57I restriction-modification methylase domain-containing protein [Chromatiales bacterium]|nr:Eco57I restriction-modification methylase domain-containing protein [Chromatiales bacterium]